jgi:hypothetical protein
MQRCGSCYYFNSPPPATTHNVCCRSPPPPRHRRHCIGVSCHSRNDATMPRIPSGGGDGGNDNDDDVGGGHHDGGHQDDNKGGLHTGLWILLSQRMTMGWTMSRRRRRWINIILFRIFARLWDRMGAGLFSHSMKPHGSTPTYVGIVGIVRVRVHFAYSNQQVLKIPNCVPTSDVDLTTESMHI